MGPKERKAKYADEEKKMLERRKEAEMLREASVVASSRKSISRPGSRVLEETHSMLFENKYNNEGDSIYNDTNANEEYKDNLDDEDMYDEETQLKRAEERKRLEEEEAALYPNYGGQYAHEVFWPAFALARSGNYSGVVEWLEKGMHGDVREPETGQSLLMCAAISNSDILIRMLLRKGGKVNGRCNKGWTPLHHCIASGTPYLYIADQLMGRGEYFKRRERASRNGSTVVIVIVIFMT